MENQTQTTTNTNFIQQLPTITKPVNKLPVLIIDGNYFGHRAIHGIRISQPGFNLSTTNEMLVFERELLNELIGLWTSFSDIIGNMIIVTDNGSWRKMVEPFRPYYIEENSIEKIGYKANREEKKDDINWENWRFCLDNFCNRISEIMPIFNIPGLEGDDAIALLTRYYAAQGIINVVFCTDGDLRQTVTTEYTFLYRNTRSKLNPDGVINISNSLAQTLYNNTQKEIHEQFLQKSSGVEDFAKRLFKLKIGNGFVINRSLGAGVELAEPLKNGIIKNICGDKKDNIFPLYRWTKNIRNFSVTENMLVKVIEAFEGKFDENVAHKLLTDVDFLTTVLINLRTNCNQDGIAKNVMSHYKHNYWVNMLTVNNIPEAPKQMFKQRFDTIFSLIDANFSLEYLRAVSMQQVDDSNIISVSAPMMEVSIPGFEAKGHSLSQETPTTSKNQDLINSILGD